MLLARASLAVAIQGRAILGMADLVDHRRGVLRLVQGLHARRYHHLRVQIVADLVPCREVLLHHDTVTVLDSAGYVSLLSQAAIGVRVLHQTSPKVARAAVGQTLRSVLILHMFVVMMHMKVVVVGGRVERRQVALRLLLAAVLRIEAAHHHIARARQRAAVDVLVRLERLLH